MFRFLKEYQRIAIVLVLFVLLGTFPIGCAKDVGDDTVQDIAVVLNILSEGVAEEGLIFLQKERPDLVPEIVTNLNIIIETAQLYQDGTATVSDFVTTLNNALERINALTDFLDQEQAELISRSISRASMVFNRYIQEVTVPEEAGVYIQAVSSGIQSGIDIFNGTTTMNARGEI